MKVFSAPLLRAAAVAACVFGIGPMSASAGDVCGKVMFTGEKRPKRSEIKMNADPYCDKHNTGKKIGSEDFLIGKEGQMANVFVYVTAGVTGKFDPPAEKPLLDQVGCMYTPHVLGMVKGQSLQIKNSDATLHNVHCLSKANPEFNFGQPVQNDIREKPFRKAEEAIKIKCDVHPWMGAWLFVLDHPFFSVSDRDGKFEIKGLPAGKYTLTAWHEKLGTTTKEVEVAGDGKIEGVDFTFDGSKGK